MRASGGEGLWVGLRSPAHPNGASGAAGGNRRKRGAGAHTPSAGGMEACDDLAGPWEVAGAATMEGEGEKTAAGGPFLLSLGEAGS